MIFNLKVEWNKRWAPWIITSMLGHKDIPTSLKRVCSWVCNSKLIKRKTLKQDLEERLHFEKQCVITLSPQVQSPQALSWLFLLMFHKGLWDSPNEPSEGVPHQTQHSQLSHICRWICHWLLQKTGKFSARNYFVQVLYLAGLN